MEVRRPRLWRTRVDGNLRATLVWNRHVDEISADWRSAYGKFNDLNLSVYDGARNIAVDISNSKQQNVEQIAVEGRGEAILRLDSPESSFGSWKTETFALAYSDGVLEPVTGPRLRIECGAPQPTQAESRFTVNCRVQNHGDTKAFSVFASLALPAGFSSTTARQSAGDIASGSEAWVKFEIVTEGQLPALKKVDAIASSVTFGIEFAGRT